MSSSACRSAGRSPWFAPRRPGPPRTDATTSSPDDVKELAEPVLAHRLVLEAEAEFEGATAADALAAVLSDVVPPAVRAQAQEQAPRQ
nr:hypothetical protein DA06_18545 [Georgenia sp. SUBG003]